MVYKCAAAGNEGVPGNWLAQLRSARMASKLIISARSIPQIRMSAGKRNNEAARRDRVTSAGLLIRDCKLPRINSGFSKLRFATDSRKARAWSGIDVFVSAPLGAAA